LSVPVEATVQLPVQVMVQVPALHETFAPSPTVWVQSFPLHATWHDGPQVPEQLEVPLHEKLQPLVEAEHASKEHVASVEQAQLVPLQTEPQPVRESERARARVRKTNFMT